MSGGVATSSSGLATCGGGGWYVCPAAWLQAAAALQRAAAAAGTSVRRRGYKQQRRLVRPAGGAASIRGICCVPATALLLKDGAAAATSGGGACYLGPTTLLQAAVVPATSGQLRCYQRPVAQLVHRLHTRRLHASRSCPLPSRSGRRPAQHGQQFFLVHLLDRASFQLSLPASSRPSRPPPPPPPPPRRRRPPPPPCPCRRPPRASRRPADVAGAAPLLSQQELSTAIRDLATAVQGIRLACPPRPGLAAPAVVVVAAGPRRRARLAAPVIQRVSFPPSPSRLPAWVTATEPPPVYSSASAPPPVYTTAGDPPRPSFPEPAYSRLAEPSAGRAEYQGAAGPTPPRYAKLDFATYDGVEDPLNWLNQCEQFFRGQRTLASDRTWLASYHLRGAAQTWYYSLEQDEGGMPPWDRFRELCLLRFGPPIRGSRLAELGRLAFTTTVQEFPASRPPSPDTTRPGAHGRDSCAGHSDPAATRPFRRLTTAEQLERRRKRLCFNCDELYVPGHVCPRLFYLETVDDIAADVVAAGLADAAVSQADTVPG
ncbi:hypothetical protein QYE76_040711 [Lolium multiflorum]|uniref:Retrotransposon gag domain-containing protein n=1 Tax=Lolium multiflorum TaxID=4521 RepID=A0AAD8WVQ1_LOLMU|nr:hypothetical protein QYE76_040711 [Lolium multiflorum]